jgi:flagellar biosynthesis protein FlhF
MKLKKYEVADMKEALRLIKQELGPDAVILTTRKITKTTGLGLFPRAMLEVTAAVDYDRKQVRNQPNARAPQPEIQEDEEESITYTPASLTRRGVAQMPPPPQPPLRQSNYEDDYLKELMQEESAPQRQDNMDSAKMVELLASLGLDKVPSILNDLGQIKKQLDDMRSTLNEPANLTVDLPDNLKEYYTAMTRNGLDELIAYRFLKGLEKRLPDLVGRAQLKSIIIDEFAAHIPIEEGYIAALNRKVTAFIGATGVGKTTTIAKIAADLVLKYTKKVCLITVDNFRIGAVEQLKTYAEIVDLPLFVATNPIELERLLKDIMDDYDYILLDSTGRSPYDDVSLSDTAEFLSAVPGVMPVLVISMGANHRELPEVYERYSALEPEYIIFTKLDETKYFGAIANIAIKKKTPILLLATGQDVPEDMEVPNGKKIAKKLLQEKPTLWKDN